MLQYRLEIKASGALCIKLAEANSRKILYLDTLRNLAQSTDAQALELLIKLHLKTRSTQSKDTLSFQEIELPAPVSNEAIRLMAKTGRLLFQGKPLEACPQKEMLIFRGQLHSPMSATLEATLTRAPLSAISTLFPGSPPWGIHEGQWFELNTALPWKWIQLFAQGPATLEGVQKKKFLEEEPPILWATAPRVPLRVLPRLQLTDASGSFANLWMEYPDVGRIDFDDLCPHIHGQSRLKADELQWERDLIEAGYQRRHVETSRYHCAVDKVPKTLRFLLELGWICVDARGKQIVRQTGYNAHIAESADALRLTGSVSFGAQEAPLQKALTHTRPLLDLDHERVGLLDAPALPRLEGEWVEDALPIPRTHIGALLPLLEETNVVWDERLRAAAAALQNGVSFEPAPLDSRFCGQLLPYQQTGVAWLGLLHRWRLGALLADEMGLGKTVQVLAFFSQLQTKLPLLIVAPTSLLFNWRSEITRFWPSAQVYVHAGPERLKELAGLPVILTSYALLRSDASLFETIEFEAVALDEANAIKTASSLTADAASKLRARFKIAITGTPVENAPEELWSQFRFLMPDLLGSKKQFQEAERLEVRLKVRPFILRRKKSDVALQLPEKVDHPVWVSMTEEQQAVYDRTLSALKSGLLTKVSMDGLAAHRMEVLEAILRLRQIALDPRLIGEMVSGAKPQKLMDDVAALLQEGKKVLILTR